MRAGHDAVANMIAKTFNIDKKNKLFIIFKK